VQYARYNNKKICGATFMYNFFFYNSKTTIKMAYIFLYRCQGF